MKLYTKFQIKRLDLHFSHIQVGPRTECANRFKNFLRTYVDDRGHNLYREKIRSMCEQNLCSLEVDYNILAAECSVLAFFLPEAPTEMLQVLIIVSHMIIHRYQKMYTFNNFSLKSI